MILTATRTGKALGARWSEFDLDAGVWTVPAGRMKMGTEHRDPLSTAALEVLSKAMAHAIGDKVEAAYRRGDLFEKRTRLMQAWADYWVTAPKTGEGCTARPKDRLSDEAAGAYSV